jgi:thymidine phosphorylase
VLAGGGPPDVVELTLALARQMLDVAGLPDADPAEALAAGRAMDSWRAMIRAQGGDPDAKLPVAPEVEPVRATADGYVTAVDAYGMGVAAWRLGAGRARKEDPVAAAAGVLLRRRPGDPVRAGDVLYELHAEDARLITVAAPTAAAAVTVGSAPPKAVPLVRERIDRPEGE